MKPAQKLSQEGSKFSCDFIAIIILFPLILLVLSSCCYLPHFHVIQSAMSCQSERPSASLCHPVSVRTRTSQLHMDAWSSSINTSQACNSLSPIHASSGSWSTLMCSASATQQSWSLVTTSARLQLFVILIPVPWRTQIHLGTNIGSFLLFFPCPVKPQMASMAWWWLTNFA